MKLLVAVTLSLFSLVTSRSHEKHTEWPISVILESHEGSVVKVKVKNEGGMDVNLFSRGNVLDSNPVHKLNLISTSGMVTVSRTTLSNIQ
jgi:hypothetical protein